MKQNSSTATKKYEVYLNIFGVKTNKQVHIFIN